MGSTVVRAQIAWSVSSRLKLRIESPAKLLPGQVHALPPCFSISRKPASGAQEKIRNQGFTVSRSGATMVATL